MALREIVGRIVDTIFGFITEITSFVLFVAGKEHKALHDYIAGTVVLHDPDKVLASDASPLRPTPPCRVARARPAPLDPG